MYQFYRAMQWIEAAPSASLHLPAPNVFIPKDFTIKDMVEKEKIPIVIWKSSYSRLWYKRDTIFLTPKAHASIEFCCPRSKESPEASVLTDIFTSLLMDYLNEYAYDAQVAGLYYGINNTDKGFQVVISGYNDKMRILMERIISNIAKFEVKSNRFSVIKESLMKAYKNIKFQQPHAQASYYCSLLLEYQSWPWNDELEVIPHLEPNDLAEFLPHLLSKCFVESYISGNIESNEAKSLIQHIEEVLFMSSPPICKALLPSQYFNNRIVKLGKGKNYHYPVEALNQSDENSALLNYIQVHRDDVKMNVELQLFTMVAKQQAFHQLRTVEQLGYITYLARRNHSGIRGMEFVIQSTVKDPTQLNARVNAFLEKYAENLQEMSAKEFESNVNALIDMKLEKDKNLIEESSFYWNEISTGTLKFDRRETEVAALRELTKKELVDFFNEYVNVDGPRRKSLSVQVFGGLHSAEYKIALNDESENKANRIDDLIKFRQSRPLYGSFSGGFG